MQCKVIRFPGVSGSGEKRNDILFLSDCSKESDVAVIFFGGDVQNYESEMLAHRDNARYAKWSLERVASTLYEKFRKLYSNPQVFVIRADSYYLKTFASYRNFVQSSPIGIPTHNAVHGGLAHLASLYSQVKQILATTSCETHVAHFASSNKAVDVILVGFSKGCVVLNQLIHELAALQSPTDNQKSALDQDFVRSLSDFYFLDGGHSGNEGVWVTNGKTVKNWLTTLSRYRSSVSSNEAATSSSNDAKALGVHVHVTPYEIGDVNRPWNRDQYEAFLQVLRSCNAELLTLSHFVHFEQAERSLENHFGVLEAFL